MKFKSPKIILLAQTVVDDEGFEALLSELGVSNAAADACVSDAAAQELIEIAGRLCYRSFEPGLNPNVSKVREGNDKYLGNILRQRHGSVLEHASVTFAFLNVTRVFTHEIVRHRAGMAFSQESLRYVRLEELSAYLPEAFAEHSHSDLLEGEMRDAFELLERLQIRLAKVLGLDDMSDFSEKKKLTSAMRRLAPIGLCTNIIVTANHRAWRHIVGMRCNEHAEEEIRVVMLEVARQLKEKFPNIYQDMTIVDGENATFEYEKV